MRNTIANIFFYLSVALLAIFLAVFTVSLILLSNLSDKPENLKPGDPVAILTGQTIMVEGQPCQENTLGFVSPTGPNKEKYWHKANRFILPFQRLVSVINMEGIVSWQVDYHVVKLPATPDQLICPLN